MTDKGLRGIARKKGVNAAVKALFRKSMGQWPEILLSKIQANASRFGMSGGLISDTAEEHIKQLSEK